MGAVFSSFYKTVADAGTPEALGGSAIQFNTAVFIGRKSSSALNAGIVRIVTGTGSFELYPGVGQHWHAPVASYVDASQFSVEVANDGDGVLCAYALASFKAFSDLESKLESAIAAYIRTIAATLDDCSITTGISDEERTEDNINVHVSGCEEMPIHSGQFNCEVRVEVRSQVGKAGEENRLDRHRLRTAYVRDLLMDPDAEEIISSLATPLTVYDNGIHGLSFEQDVDGRQWVSQATFSAKASASDLR